MFVNWCKHVFCTWHKPAPKIRICRYVCTRDTKDTRPRTGSGSDTRTARQSLHSEVRLTTTASVTEGVAAVSWISIESLMIRRPFGSIDPNSIRETELHTECRRRRERESLYSPQHDINRKTALCHHRPQTKSHSNEYVNITPKAEQALPAGTRTWAS